MMIPMEDERWNLPRVQISDTSLGPIGDADGQHCWGWAVALPYRAIAAPWSGVVMPPLRKTFARRRGALSTSSVYRSTCPSL